MGQHRAGSLWGFRWPPGVWKKIKGKKKYRPNGFVMTEDKKNLRISIEGYKDFAIDGDIIQVITDRKTARLMARRILECLEATK